MLHTTLHCIVWYGMVWYDMIWYDCRVTSLMSTEQKWSKSATPSCTDQVRTQYNQAHAHTWTSTLSHTLTHPLTHMHTRTHTHTHKYSRLQVVNRMARRVHRLTLTRAFFSHFSILFVTSYILHFSSITHDMTWQVIRGMQRAWASLSKKRRNWRKNS